MGKTSKDEAYERFINRIWECPVCGGDMVYIGGLLDWQCRDCGALGSSGYDQSTGEDYIEVLDAYSDGEIYEDPEDNKPYNKPAFFTCMYGKVYICSHPVYSRCTLFKVGSRGLAVIQQRFGEKTKCT